MLVEMLNPDVMESSEIDVTPVIKMRDTKRLVAALSFVKKFFKKPSDDVMALKCSKSCDSTSFANWSYSSIMT